MNLHKFKDNTASEIIEKQTNLGAPFDFFQSVNLVVLLISFIYIRKDCLEFCPYTKNLICPCAFFPVADYSSLEIIKAPRSLDGLSKIN